MISSWSTHLLKVYLYHHCLCIYSNQDMYDDQCESTLHPKGPLVSYM